MVYQLNIQTIALTRRSHLIVRFPVADTAAWVWSITGAVRRPRIRAECLSRLHRIVVDAHEMPGLARFRTQAPGWKVLCEREGEIVVGTDENAPAGMCFMPVTDPKTVKNRLHLDLASSAQDREQKIGRLLALGAGRAGIGQAGAESWPVLADPEGNEFCVIRPKATLTRSDRDPHARW
jgi:hypothetical protein